MLSAREPQSRDRDHERKNAVQEVSPAAPNARTATAMMPPIVVPTIVITTVLVWELSPA